MLQSSNFTAFRWLAILCCICASCVERITIETDNQSPKLVVIAMLTSDTEQQYVFVTKSIHYFGTDTVPVVADAKVFVNGERLRFEPLIGAYCTLPSFFITPGEVCSLRVLYDLNGDGIDEEFLAEETVPNPMLIDPPGTPMGLRLIPINLEGDTTRYAMPMVCAGLLRRQNVSDATMRIVKYYNGIQVAENITQYAIGSIPNTMKGSSVPVSIDMLSRGSFKLKDHEDSTFYRPFDTIGYRIFSINPAMEQFISSANQESYGGGNPMFGGAPANVECNISGDGVVGCLGVAATSPMVSLVLPMNKTTLDNLSRDYVCLRDSTVRIRIKNNGIATYVTGGNAGQIYFTMAQVVPAIKGFRTYEGRNFYMTSYSSFYELVGPNDTLAWTLAGRR